MNLKDKRYNLYIIDEGSLDDVGENYHPKGKRIDCQELLEVIYYLQYKLELSDSEVLEHIKDNLK